MWKCGKKEPKKLIKFNLWFAKEIKRKTEDILKTNYEKDLSEIEIFKLTFKFINCFLKVKVWNNFAERKWNSKVGKKSSKQFVKFVLQFAPCSERRVRDEKENDGEEE